MLINPETAQTLGSYLVLAVVIMAAFRGIESWFWANHETRLAGWNRETAKLEAETTRLMYAKEDRPEPPEPIVPLEDSLSNTD